MHITKIIFDTSNFWILNWYYVVAVLISITGLILAYKNYKKKPVTRDDKEYQINKFSSTSNPTITITNNINDSSKKGNYNLEEMTSNHDEKLKAIIKILFIDDNHTEYKMVSILKRAGWLKTKSVKDITDLDAQVVIESDIIFVDINGVGLTLFEDQGLGLASALKIKYPKKKIVIYSAETSGDRFHKALRQVDDCLSKNAEPYQFINLVENLSKSL